MKYLMIITYSWDSDYVAIPCETEKEAIEWLTKYLNEEVATIKYESEYNPIVRKHMDTLVELIYESDEDFVDSNSDIATYRVFEVGHGFNDCEFYYTGKIK